ncbi:hypothetical protein ACWEO7_39165, partial [Nocardia sp. NPDC004260]
MTRTIAAPGPDLTSYDHIVISISGGKDSQSTLDVVVEAARAAGVTDRITAVHADLGRAEWPGTAALAAEHARNYLLTELTTLVIPVQRAFSACGTYSRHVAITD